MKNERTYQVIIGALVFVILVGGWYVLTKKESGTTIEEAAGTVPTGETVSPSDAAVSSAVSGNASSNTESTKMAAGEAITVADQSAGENVTVASLTLNQPGWVAVRDENGRTLGAGWFAAGALSDVVVPLLRATEAGQRYQVLLYADDGDKAFDLHKDTLITNSDKSVAGTTFSTK